MPEQSYQTLLTAIRTSQALLIGEAHAVAGDWGFLLHLLEDLRTGHPALPLVFLMEYFPSEALNRLQRQARMQAHGGIYIGDISGDAPVQFRPAFEHDIANAVARQIPHNDLIPLSTTWPGLDDLIKIMEMPRDNVGKLAKATLKIRRILEYAGRMNIAVYGIDLPASPPFPDSPMDVGAMRLWMSWNRARDAWMGHHILAEVQQGHFPVAFIGANHASRISRGHPDISNDPGIYRQASLVSLVQRDNMSESPAKFFGDGSTAYSHGMVNTVLHPFEYDVKDGLGITSDNTLAQPLW
jgi:hypothetical protein